MAGDPGGGHFAVEGVDTLGSDSPVASIARRLPKFGVTAFCPTTVACSPSALERVLDQVRRARETPDPQAARVLHGVPLETGAPPGRVRVLGPGGELLALADVVGGRLKYLRVFH